MLLDRLSAEVQKVRGPAEATRTALQGLQAETQALPQDARRQLAENLEALQGSVADELRCLDYFRIPELKVSFPDASKGSEYKALKPFSTAISKSFQGGVLANAVSR